MPSGEPAKGEPVVQEGFDPGRYGRTVSDYDALYPGVQADTDAAVRMLYRLARAVHPHAIVEFGVGTGRLALPLAANGLSVAGIDGSERMLSKLREKDGGPTVDVHLGDYRHTVVSRHAFSVVVLALNGIFDPRGTVAQLDIFRNAVGHLVPGGSFVVESWVMHDHDRTGEWTVWPRFVGEQHVEFQLARYNVEDNTIERTLLHLRSSGTDFVTVRDTYASPGELDVMAMATGFERVARYGSWTGTPFTSSSTQSISVFRRKV